MTTLKTTRNISIASTLVSDKSLTQKASLNAAASALDYGSRLLTGFVVTPFLVAGLGDALYGIWRTLGNLTGYLTAASGRPSQALKWTIASLQSSTDYEEKRRKVGSAMVVWLLFLPLLSSLGAVLVWYAPIWLKSVPSDLYWVVRGAAGLLVAQMILATLVRIPESVLEGENLGYKRMGLSATVVFVGGGLTILALYLDAGLVGVAAAALATVILRGMLYVLVARTHVPWFGAGKPPRQEVRKFFGLSKWFLVWRLVILLMTAGDLVILGVLASAEMVTIYSITRYAPETLINLVAIVVFGSTPGLGGIVGSGDLEKAARVRGELMLLTWLMATTIGTNILLWNPAFIELWVGGERYAGSTPNLLILVMTIQFILIRNDSNIIDLTLDISRKVIIGLVSATLGVVIAAAMVGLYEAGIIGLVLGLMAGRSILSLTYPWMIGRFLRIPTYSQIRAVLRPAMVSIVFFLLASRLGDFITAKPSFPVDGWIQLILSVSVTFAATVSLAVYLGMSRDQRKLVFRRIRMVMTTASKR